MALFSVLVKQFNTSSHNYFKPIPRLYKMASLRLQSWIKKALTVIYKLVSISLQQLGYRHGN